MNTESKIKLENDLYLCLYLKNNRLDYDLQYNEYIFNEEEIRNKFMICEENIDGSIVYDNKVYKKITELILKEGNYLFILHKNIVFLQFSNNKISFTIDKDGVDNIIDLTIM
jgi:hypothetical protein